MIFAQMKSVYCVKLLRTLKGQDMDSLGFKASVSFTKFHVNAAKYISGKQGERCKTGFVHTQTSAVSKHANETGHFPSWNQVKFIDRDPHRYTRRVKEAIEIRLHPNNINRDSGIEIPEAWIPTIKKHNSCSTTKRNG